MLRYFFEDDRNSSGEKTDHAQLFQGLSIMCSGEEYLRHMGNYPVIALSLKAAKQEDFQQSFDALKETLAEEFDRHSYILKSECLAGRRKGNRFTRISLTAKYTAAWIIYGISCFLQGIFAKKARGWKIGTVEFSVSLCRLF